MTSRGKLAEKSEATRSALVAAARVVFARHGYAETTIEDIVRRAKVTRGALYHHFTGKGELFSAVYEQMEEELAQRSLLAASKGSGAMEQMRLGIDAFLDGCLDPGVQRIVLLDALTVLGWEKWHDIGTKYNFALMKAGLEAAVQEGALAPRPVEALAHLVQGALMRAGLVLARAENPPAARRELGAEIAKLLDSLKAPEPARRSRQGRASLRRR